MVQWGVSRRVMFVGPRKENNSQLSSSIVGEEDEMDKGDEEIRTAESVVTNQKRKRVCSSRLKMAEVRRCEKQRQSCSFKKSKRKNLRNSIDRWSAERYKRAEQSMLEIMKAEGAVFGNPILRPALRLVARKHIGDTGLLDHLLKHMDGKVAPGGTERFRRWHNPNGVMEYWLESADLVNIRHEAGVQDPYWIPPPMWKPGGSPSEDLVLSEELESLKAEMAKLKRDVQELISKKQEEHQARMIPNSSSANQNFKLDGSLFSFQGTHKELLVWKAKTEQQLMEISNSLSGTQGMCKELDKWKANIEHQLRDISNSLNRMQQRDDLAPWLESSDLINFQDEDIAPWLESADLNIQGNDLASWLDGDELVKIEPKVVQNPGLVAPPDQKPGNGPSQDSICAKELGLLKDDLAKMKRDVLELVPKKEVADQANVTPYSSVTTHSRLDLDNSLLLLQEMYKDLVKWKDKIEQQVMEISNSLSGMQALF